MNEQDLGLYKKWNFPTGEVGIALNTLKEPLVLRWRKDTDIMEWLQVIDAYKRHRASWDGVVNIPYLPYSRQDKVFHHGESCASELLIKMLELMGIKYIKTYDVHSVRRIIISGELRASTHEDYLPRVTVENKWAQYFPTDVNYICYPDKNACDHGFSRGNYDSISKFSKTFLFSKTRSSDGTLQLKLETPINFDLTHKSIIINDDICDGGATFIEAARQLKALGFKYIELFVTHGFFTKGLDVLYEAGINKIITTDTVCDLPETERLKIIKVC